jgi:hypothetical protein
MVAPVAPRRARVEHLALAHVALADVHAHQAVGARVLALHRLGVAMLGPQQATQHPGVRGPRLRQRRVVDRVGVGRRRAREVVEEEQRRVAPARDQPAGRVAEPAPRHDGVVVAGAAHHQAPPQKGVVTAARGRKVRVDPGPHRRHHRQLEGQALDEVEHAARIDRHRREVGRHRGGVACDGVALAPGDGEAVDVPGQHALAPVGCRHRRRDLVPHLRRHPARVGGRLEERAGERDEVGTAERCRECGGHGGRCSRLTASDVPHWNRGGVGPNPAIQ